MATYSVYNPERQGWRDPTTGWEIRRHETKTGVPAKLLMSSPYFERAKAKGRLVITEEAAVEVQAEKPATSKKKTVKEDGDAHR